MRLAQPRDQVGMREPHRIFCSLLGAEAGQAAHCSGQPSRPWPAGSASENTCSDPGLPWALRAALHPPAPLADQGPAPDRPPSAQGPSSSSRGSTSRRGLGRGCPAERPTARTSDQESEPEAPRPLSGLTDLNTSDYLHDASSFQWLESTLHEGRDQWSFSSHHSATSQVRKQAQGGEATCPVTPHVPGET